MQPDYGSYWFRFEGVLVYAIYEEGEQKKSSDGKTGGQRELISFAFLTRRREPVRVFREYVRGLEREKRQSITTIWTNHWSSWVPTARPVLPLAQPERLALAAPFWGRRRALL